MKPEIATLAAAPAPKIVIPDEISHLQQLVDWTGEYAELLDPLCDLPDSIAEFVHPEIAYPRLR